MHVEWVPIGWSSVKQYICFKLLRRFGMTYRTLIRAAPTILLPNNLKARPYYKKNYF